MKKLLLHIKNDSVPLSNILQRDNNNFELLRLFAALIVIFRHALDLFKPEFEIANLRFVGDLALYFLFFLSGLLVTESFKNSKSLLSFFSKDLYVFGPD